MRGKLAGLAITFAWLSACNQHDSRAESGAKPTPILSAAYLGPRKPGEVSEDTRILIGRGPDYSPIAEDPDQLFSRLEGSMADRRAIAWQIVEAMLQPQSVTVNKQTVEVPLWHTWYEGLSLFDTNPELSQKIELYIHNLATCHEDSACKKTNDDIIKETMASHGGQDQKDLARNLTNANFTQKLRQFQDAEVQSGPDLGEGFTLFSPSFVEHILAQAQAIEECASNRVPWDQAPPSAKQFSTCITEFPRSAVMVKAAWAPLGEAATDPKTDGASMTKMLSNGTWPEIPASAGDASKMYTVETREAEKFGLQALHISTKDTRQWTWVTLWWSPDPNSDFGADRPASIAKYNGGVWANYKMCVTTAFNENDATPWGSYEKNQPSLAASLKAVYEAIAKQPGPKPYDHVTSWCSDPNIEQQTNNGKTNCIGCHQYSMAWDEPKKSFTRFGQTLQVPRQMDFPQFGRSQRRSTFQADFSWSFDNEQLATLIADSRKKNHYEWPKSPTAAHPSKRH
jgi:hypothetical protein